MKINNRVITRNIILCFTAQILPMLAAFFAIPYTINGLGIERFGIFSLARVSFDYFTVFDLGLGRAATKFTAEALALGNNKRASLIIWTSLFIQIILGLAGAVILIIITPFLCERIFKIPPLLVLEAKKVFYILSAAVAAVICSKTLKGALEAKQRFDLINLVQIPISCLVFLLPVIGIALGFGFPLIIFSITILWIIGAFFYLFFCFKAYPELKKGFKVEKTLFKPLFNFGGWVSLANLFVPVLVYFDRFIISAVISVAALTYYTAPYDLISRISFIPIVICSVLFPIFGSLAVSSRDELKKLYTRSLRYVILILGPIFIIIALFSKKIMGFWLGNKFVLESALILQILSMGLFLNSIAQIPGNILDAIGRPDLKVKIYLSYVFVYLGLSWFLIVKFGIIGAAIAWTVRSALEAVLFTQILRKNIGD